MNELKNKSMEKCHDGDDHFSRSIELIAVVANMFDEDEWSKCWSYGSSFSW